MKDSKNEKELIKEEKQFSKCHTSYLGKGWNDYAPLSPRIHHAYKLTDKDMTNLPNLKKKVSRKFKELAKLYHPDSSIKNAYNKKRKLKGCTFNQIKRVRDYIMGLEIVPITIDNVENVLRLTKGYKSTEDVFLPWE